MPNQPASLWLLRHGQSLGNVARDAAREPGILVLDIAQRDMDVPLSEYGHRQARAFGEWMAAQPSEELPDVVITSPYVRAVQTAETALAAAGLTDVRVQRDERLRERELGVLDLLTREGVLAKYPDEALRRERLGKFYHRPPGGESWVDVGLRLRSLRDSIAIEHDGRRVLIVTHEVVIIMFRYLLEDLTEPTALALSAAQRLANCSLTSYITAPDGRLALDQDAWTAPLEEGDAPVTKAHDAPVAPR
jgi:broad specificity phosphatase PhoE